MTLSIKAIQLLERLEKHGVRLGLESVGKLLVALDRPESKIPVVLIAGTNGKGSTATLLASMAAAAGYTTGLYTSPHLQEVSERIRIDGRAISNPILERALFEIVEVSEKELEALPTYFEVLTAMAFKIFFDENVDLAVIEVGLGGRLDATNLASPLLSLLTEVGLEHQDFLGTTLGSIAREKAGILRPGKPAIAWTARAEVWNTFQQVAQEVGADLTRAQEKIEVNRLGHDSRPTDPMEAKQRMRVSSPSGEATFTMGLLGRHQLANLGLAILGAQELQASGFERLDRQSMVQGVATCQWPGRLEIVRLPDQGSILLDAAHNADGAASLSEYLEDLAAPYDLLFGSLAGKDVESYLPLLAGGAGKVILTAPVNSKALPAGALCPLISDHPNVAIEENVGVALRRALDGADEASDRAVLLVVCGSIYLVGDVRTRLCAAYGEPLSAGSTALFAGPGQRSA